MVCSVSGQKHLRTGDLIELDYQNFFQHRKIFYYDALPTQKPDQSDAEFEAALDVAQRRHSVLRQVYGCHVNVGKTVAKKRKKLEQKGVDVLLAIEALGHVHRKNAKEVTLLTGDEDFTPLVRELVREGAYVTVWHEKKSTSVDLIEAADFAQDLDLLHALSNTTEAFRAKHPSPRVYGLADDLTKKIKLSFQSGSGNGQLRLFKGEGVWRLIREWDDKYNHVTHANLEVVRLVAKQAGWEFPWDSLAVS
jgi:uncharacterized LabA/DUF88 family protein